METSHLFLMLTNQRSNIDPAGDRKKSQCCSPTTTTPKRSLEWVPQQNHDPCRESGTSRYTFARRGRSPVDTALGLVPYDCTLQGRVKSQLRAVLTAMASFHCNFPKLSARDRRTPSSASGMVHASGAVQPRRLADSPAGLSSPLRAQQKASKERHYEVCVGGVKFVRSPPDQPLLAAFERKRVNKALW
jgi:hypothetical protein